MVLRRSITLLFASAAAVSGLVLGIGGTASATTAPVAPASVSTTQHTSLTPAAAKAVLEQDLTNHTVAAPANVAHPDLSCSYLYVCGQGGNGNSFAYTTCNQTYTLPDLIGNGPLINNQIPGTVSYFYDASGNFLFSSTAYDYEPSIDWTPVQYAIAC